MPAGLDMASQQRFRKRNQDLIEVGRKYGRELECCHIIAKSNGGANNQDNYIMGGGNFNRMIGNRHDKVMMALAYDLEGLGKVIAAIRASPNSGYREEDAWSLVVAGRQEFAEMESKLGGIDMMDGGKNSPLLYA